MLFITDFLPAVVLVWVLVGFVVYFDLFGVLVYVLLMLIVGVDFLVLVCLCLVCCLLRDLDCFSLRYLLLLIFGLDCLRITVDCFVLVIADSGGFKA